MGTTTAKLATPLLFGDVPSLISITGVIVRRLVAVDIGSAEAPPGYRFDLHTTQYTRLRHSAYVFRRQGNDSPACQRFDFSVRRREVTDGQATHLSFDGES